MKIRVADYIADMLVKNGIHHVFSVTGGGAMHLNDGLGHKEGLTCIYNHHEQACAIAAESYARINNQIAAVCVTTGPGGTNAITGVLGGWLDSIPMLILSGQVRYDTTVRSTGLNIRAYGDQEYDIVKMVSNITKYAWMVTDAADIRYCLEKALYLAKTGRPGPVWLDIPLNVQGAYIETEQLRGYDPLEEQKNVVPKVTDELAKEIIAKIRNAKRPVFNAGNGSACVVGSHGYEIKKGQRFITNSAVASMGYDLPAAIGACIASGEQDMICVTGEGSIQMNLQELQTIIHHRFPIKIFVINNGGYHSIRQTQKNFFGDPLVGIGAESGDLSFPSMEKLAWAYGYPYQKITDNCRLEEIKETLQIHGPAICEVFVDTQQKFEPKCASKRLEDGSMVSAPLEDLAPFLSQEELKQQMFIPLFDEEMM